MVFGMICFEDLLREKPLGTFGLVIVIILFLAGIFANQLAPYGMNEIHLADRLQGSILHVFTGNRPTGTRYPEPVDLTVPVSR